MAKIDLQDYQVTSDPALHKTSMMLILYCFAECGGVREASVISQRIMKEIAHFVNGIAIKESQPPEAYWKISGVFEFSYTLSPASKAAFVQIMKCCDHGWTVCTLEGEQDSVWNRSVTKIFLTPEITWARILLWDQ